MAEQLHELLHRAADELKAGNSKVAVDSQLASHLVLWLRIDAKQCRLDMVMSSSPRAALDFAEGRYVGALAVARKILGES